MCFKNVCKKNCDYDILEWSFVFIFSKDGGGGYTKRKYLKIVFRLYSSQKYIFDPFDIVGKYEIVINSLNKLLINSYKFQNKHRVVFSFV